MKFRKIFLCVLFLLFVFSLGFALGRLRQRVCQQVNNGTVPKLNLQVTAPHINNSIGQLKEMPTLFEDCPNIYVYDTEQKVDDYYKKKVQSILDEGFPLENPVVSEAIDDVKRLRPLVVAGRIGIFFDNNNGDYCNISAECSDFFQNCSLCILIIGV